jgi:hypothetical protein
MTMTIDTNQRQAAMPNAALVGLVDPRLGTGWAGGIATREWGTSRTHGFTAKRSARHLGRSST